MTFYFMALFILYLWGTKETDMTKKKSPKQPSERSFRTFA